MEENVLQELISALRDNARALDANTAALAAVAHKATGQLKAGSKPGKFSWEKSYVQALARDYPNDHGWFKCKIGSVTRAEWFDTKSKTAAELVERAKEDELPVAITFNEKQNGRYTNRYLMTIQILDADSEVESGSDGQQRKAASSSRSRKSAPAAAPDDDEEEALEEAPF